jgi:hypothetical protein
MKQKPKRKADTNNPRRENGPPAGWIGRLKVDFANGEGFIEIEDLTFKFTKHESGSEWTITDNSQFPVWEQKTFKANQIKTAIVRIVEMAIVANEARRK